MTMGRISRLWDLKYGIDGLEMPIRDSETNHVVKTLEISKNPKKIFEFFGYSFERWEKGFENSEELREFLFSSPRIHKGFLSTDSENTKHRKRDNGTRKLFSSWVKWFRENVDKFPDKADLPIPQTREEKVKYIEKYFPESRLSEQVEEVLQEIRETKEAREKFSGDHIGAMFPDLSKEDFQALMIIWSDRWESKAERRKYILDNPIETLQSLVFECYKELNSQKDE